MMNLYTQLMNDDAGFIVSSELILVATIAVLSMLVGLSEVSNNINQELEDVGSAFASVNQGYQVRGFSGCKAVTYASSFGDQADFCDGEDDITCNGIGSGENHTSNQY